MSSAWFGGRQAVGPVPPPRLSNKYALRVTRYHHHLCTANKLGLASFLPQIKDQPFEHNGEGQPNEIINHSLNPAHKWEVS